MQRARAAALRVAERVGEELDLPVFLYGESRRGAAPRSSARGPGELQRRVDAGELAPDFGPARLDERGGAVIVGARRPLIAFNVNLRGGRPGAAREIAAVVRETGGGFPGVRALGLELRRRASSQVSMNVEDWEAAALHDIVARVEAEAHARGAEVAGSELVGLMPAGAAAAAAGGALRHRRLRRVAGARAAAPRPLTPATCPGRTDPGAGRVPPSGLDGIGSGARSGSRVCTERVVDGGARLAACSRRPS